jgi:hypothetical protein
MGAYKLQHEGDAILFWNDVAPEAPRRDFTDLTGLPADRAAAMRQAVSAEHRRHKGAKAMRSSFSISVSAMPVLAVGLCLTACSGGFTCG